MTPSRRQDPDDANEATLPERVPVMPIKSTVVFPTGATSLQIGFAPNVEILTRYERDQAVALVHTGDDDMPISPRSLEKVGVLVRILNRLNLPGGTVQTTIQGLIRIRLEEVRFEEGHYTACMRLVEETPADEEEVERAVERILTILGGIGANVERLADVPRILRSNLGDPGRFADLTATLAHFDVEAKNEVLQILDVGARLNYVGDRLDEEWQRLREKDPEPEAAPPKPEPRRRESDAARIRRKIATLQAELGEIDPAERDAIAALRRIDATDLPARVSAIARAEAERLRMVSPASPDAAEIRSYLNYLIELPWAEYNEADQLDAERVERKLNETHLGLDEVKRRIVEFVSVANLRHNVNGPIPCIVGPPDVGKKSLAEAVADGLGRPLIRLELGGRGEEDIVGRRRVRNDAHPGKVIEGFHEAGVRDPVFLLEEIDQIGIGNVDGDPVEALEEILDPAHRIEFVDRYLDLPFDLSEAFFVATANDFQRIPRSLREFLIEIRIAGYTSEEKVEIARLQLMPDMIVDHGLSADEVVISDDVLAYLTRAYARDSGLGNLRRALGAVLRYLAHEKSQSTARRWELTTADIEAILGVPRYATTEAESAPEIGVVTGLAWTALGGELMFIEALKMPGTGRLIITGHLGDVMRESVNAAYSYVRSKAEQLGIDGKVFPDSDLHIHFPVGATPKDGPSAGAAVTLAIASALSERAVRHDLAMTGEVTLRGKILEIGGVKEKILSAYRAGLREVILPTSNERDLRDVPTDVKAGMNFHFVDHMEEVFDIALLMPRETESRKKPARKRAGSERQSERDEVAAKSPDGPRP